MRPTSRSLAPSPGIGLVLLALLLPSSAAAVSLSLVSEDTPWPGVTHRHYDTSSPSTDTWVVLVDLCADSVHVDATRAPSGLETTGSWGAGEDVQVATNGDFYQSGPRVYGDAVGRGIPWPLDQTGADPQYSWEWFYENYGWIAFGPDWVEFTHTEWVKNSSPFVLNEGWMNNTLRPPPPPGTLALVSGFPELVIEGQPITCPSATDPSCFPDRTDMRSRHPRSAMGITQDRQTLILATVDGRTSYSAGMYGLELTDLMFQLGAYVAFNVDGGGSSQMWLADRGYVNNYSGNNSGNGARSVANHWGVFAGGADLRPLRPGHCATEPPCGVIPPAGGDVDDQGACFQAFGPGQWWRSEAVGQGGHLYWTNAFASDLPSNWAWWQLHFEEAGQYLVETYAHPTYAVHDEVPYTVMAASVESYVTVDQTPSGWVTVGTFDFDAGGDQWVALYDNMPSSPGSDQHIAADTIRLTRLDGWCGDGLCDADEGCGCPADCPPVPEVPSNGLDDDCDGEVDEVEADDDDTAPDDDDTVVDDDDTVVADDDDTVVDDDDTVVDDDDTSVDDDDTVVDDDDDAVADDDDTSVDDDDTSVDDDDTSVDDDDSGGTVPFLPSAERRSSLPESGVGCGCSASGGGSGWAVWLLAGVLRRRGRG